MPIRVNFSRIDSKGLHRHLGCLEYQYAHAVSQLTPDEKQFLKELIALGQNYRWNIEFTNWLNSGKEVPKTQYLKELETT